MRFAAYASSPANLQQEEDDHCMISELEITITSMTACKCIHKNAIKTQYDGPLIYLTCIEMILIYTAVRIMYRRVSLLRSVLPPGIPSTLLAIYNAVHVPQVTTS